MRCEDCLPLIEEYFDGEVEGRAATQMRAHLAACATCAAALDALSFEQEIYTRYDRGLEVSPALWSRISAEIAREPQPESPAAGRPFLSGLRDRLAATLGTLAIRPALASSLALLFVAVTAGSLWLTHSRKPETQTGVATNNPGPSNSVTPPTRVEVPEVVSPVMSPKDGTTGGAILISSPPETTREIVRDYEGRPKAQATPPATREIDVEQVLADSSAPRANNQIVFIKADDHAAPGLDPTVFVNNASADHGMITTDARMLDAGDEALARHVEQTQMLLRSFKNARPADDGAVNVAYERKLSRKLLAENSTLQLDAETRGDKDTKQVLDSIEPFLLDIANLRDQPSREEVRSIKERVRKNEIIAALQVY
jgi:hypothetical protein